MSSDQKKLANSMNSETCVKIKTKLAQIGVGGAEGAPERKSALDFVLQRDNRRSCIDKVENRPVRKKRENKRYGKKEREIETFKNGFHASMAFTTGKGFREE